MYVFRKESSKKSLAHCPVYAVGEISKGLAVHSANVALMSHAGPCMCFVYLFLGGQGQPQGFYRGWGVRGRGYT
jgi:hypothetical protein